MGREDTINENFEDIRISRSRLWSVVVTTVPKRILRWSLRIFLTKRPIPRVANNINAIELSINGYLFFSARSEIEGSTLSGVSYSTFFFPNREICT